MKFGRSIQGATPLSAAEMWCATILSAAHAPPTILDTFLVVIRRCSCSAAKTITLKGAFVEDDGGERMLAHEPGLARFSQQPLPANLLFQSNPKLDNVDLCVEEILVQQLHSSTLNAQS